MRGNTLGLSAYAANPRSPRALQGVSNPVDPGKGGIPRYARSGPLVWDVPPAFRPLAGPRSATRGRLAGLGYIPCLHPVEGFRDRL